MRQQFVPDILHNRRQRLVAGDRIRELIKDYQLAARHVELRNGPERPLPTIDAPQCAHGLRQPGGNPLGESTHLNGVRVLGAGVPHVRFVLCELPQTRRLAYTSASIQDPQLRFSVLVTALEKSKVLLPCDKSHVGLRFVPGSIETSYRILFLEYIF